jgi:hypothetical protein
MVTGQPPYGRDPDQSECFLGATADLRPTPRAKGQPVGDAFESLCARALARLPKDRFANARDLLEAMDRHQGQPPAPTVVSVQAVPARWVPAPAAPAEIARPTTSTGTVVLVVVVLAVFVVFLMLVFVWALWLRG